MRILLDTHALLWTLNADPRGETIRRDVIDPHNEVYFSAASIWEIAIKHSAGKLSHGPAEIRKAAIKQGFFELPVYSKYTEELESLVFPDDLPRHKDPFDNLLIAQAKMEGMVFLTSDKKISKYKEPCIRYFE